MTLASKQQGLSILSILIIVLVFGFFLTATVKLLPIYMESWTIKKAVSDVVEANQGKTFSVKSIRSQIDKKYTINQIRGRSARDVKITRQKSGLYLVDANYEERVPFIQNIDVVVKFDNFQFELKATR